MDRKIDKPEDRDKKDGLKEVSLDIPGSSDAALLEPKVTNRGTEAIELVNAIQRTQGPVVQRKPEPVIDREAPVETRQVGKGIRNVIIAKYVSFEIGGVKKEFLPGKQYPVDRDIRALLMEAGVVAK